MLASFLAASQSGHLDAVLQIVANLNKHECSCLVFDFAYIDLSTAPSSDSCNSYPSAEEDVLPDTPEPRGKAMKLTCFVDVDHAGALDILIQVH